MVQDFKKSWSLYLSTQIRVWQMEGFVQSKYPNPIFLSELYKSTLVEVVAPVFIAYKKHALTEDTTYQITFLYHSI